MKTRNKVLATVIAGLFSSAALAATDGTMGATSSGQIGIDLEVLDSAEITALNDIDFGQYGGIDTGDINAGDAYCVYRNGGDGYTITPTSANGKFSLVGVLGDEIDYTVKLVGAATGAASASAVAYNTASATFSGSSARDCGATDNASVDVSITESDLRTASTDTYSDTLILLVSPI
jgi:hypothetical protein